jgi:hypothetical protein
LSLNNFEELRYKGKYIEKAQQRTSQRASNSQKCQEAEVKNCLLNDGQARNALQPRLYKTHLNTRRRKEQLI